MTKTTPCIEGKRLRCLFINAARLIGGKYRNDPMWSFVSDLTGYGSNRASQLCSELGITAFGTVREFLEEANR